MHRQIQVILKAHTQYPHTHAHTHADASRTELFNVLMYLHTPTQVLDSVHTHTHTHTLMQVFLCGLYSGFHKKICPSARAWATSVGFNWTRYWFSRRGHEIQWTVLDNNANANANVNQTRLYNSWLKEMPRCDCEDKTTLNTEKRREKLLVSTLETKV